MVSTRCCCSLRARGIRRDDLARNQRWLPPTDPRPVRSDPRYNRPAQTWIARRRCGCWQRPYAGARCTHGGDPARTRHRGGRRRESATFCSGCSSDTPRRHSARCWVCCSAPSWGSGRSRRRGRPVPGETLKGQIVTEENAAGFERDGWQLVSFEPSNREIATSIGLIAAGFGATLLIGRLGRSDSIGE